MTAATVLAPDPVTTDGDDGPAITHFYCGCDRDLSLCGKDISDLDDHGQAWWVVDADEQTCVVCWELVREPCERCGL
jgi:hypothetical protein